MTDISRFYLRAARDGSILEIVMGCPECQGVGFVVGELSGSRVRCLRCNDGRLHLADESREDRDDTGRRFDEPSVLAIHQPAHT